MNILMLTPYLPYPLHSGGQIRTYNLLKSLSKKHSITLFSLIKDESERSYIEELQKYCVKIRVFKRSEKAFTLRNIFRAGFSLYPFLVIRNFVDEVKDEVRKELQAKEYHAIHAETFYMMPNIPATSVPVLLVEQTIEYLGYLSYAKSFRYWFLKPLLYIDIFKIKLWEEFFWRACTRLIAMSQEDRQFMLKTVAPDKDVNVVENGVDVEFFEKTKKRVLPNPTVLFVGTFKWLPNVEAVQYLVEKVWPIILQTVPTAKMKIVGNAPTDVVYALAKRHNGVEVVGRVEDIRDAYANAHVLVAPVFSGKGTRYKVLEAMATRTPVVGTPIAVEGLGVQSGVHALVGATANELALHTIAVLQNENLREALAEQAQKWVFDRYNWKNIADKLDSIYLKVGDHHV
ncbi:MAG: Glycosyl transferase, group 1 family protein [Microgenomates group bacterium GW2011_GWF2_45_18]|nr:MAG: Glycosyl transferase, group 1 family protein [Microgenomates group bacterium GW2011_GWF1_44_10]KKU02336.1 MAG: Glycosyl transferase, group 1 family protein [Microgenomates group bacterium GW2011_GWF2_45_18]HAU99197.1 hypothetical protein [Candidatus Paceibacterota bacterium]HAX01727.1 hypothetical protein [Candidatus Paceibacterota bacterium]